MDNLFAEQVFSKDRCFAVSDSTAIDWMTASADPDGKRLILTAANESGKTAPLDVYRAKYWTTVLDTAYWEIAAQPDDVCGWSVKHGQAFIADGGQTGICRIHSLQDLRACARGLIDGEH